ncbi:MAG: PhoU domain-containing protein [Melioribacteraceae bacterium]|nr:PhoU domain-containing protein [Melioribacteraceae bacterium]
MLLNDDLLIKIMKDRCLGTIDQAIHYLDICHQLERIGDHATNIAEDVYFIAEADIIKHNYEKYIFGDEEETEDSDDDDNDDNDD